jgi:non-heme chloroperoxidase
MAKNPAAQDPVGLTEFKIPLSKLAPLQSFRNREGLELSYRFYPSWSERLLIFHHGIGGDSRYVGALAYYLAQQNLAAVLTPDFRGHGRVRAPKAEVSGPDALLNDLQDLLHEVEAQHPDKELYVGGHSLGGGFALKVMGHEILKTYFQGAVTFSPYLHQLFLAEGRDRDSSWLKWDWTQGRVDLQMPESYRIGSEVVAYDIKYFEAASLTTEAEFASLRASVHPLITFASTGDRLSPASPYQKLLADPVFHLNLLEGYSHMGQVMAPAAHESIAEVLRRDLLWV